MATRGCFSLYDEEHPLRVLADWLVFPFSVSVFQLVSFSGLLVGTDTLANDQTAKLKAASPFSGIHVK
jgi:hypothetical protein